jgi:hypothetical protein
MRIDNEGARAVRIPADVRLLSFEIEVPSKEAKKKPTTYKCAVPDSLRPTGFPERRALLLAAGQSYIESFDPRLFCFGKNDAALVGTAIVRPRFGWTPEKAPFGGAKSKKPPSGPFAAESADNPAPTAPVRQLTAPPFILSFGPTTSESAEPPSAVAGADANVPGAPAPGAWRPPPPPPKEKPAAKPSNVPPVSSLRPGRGRGRDIAISRKRLAAASQSAKEAQAAAKAAKEAAAPAPAPNGTVPSPAPTGAPAATPSPAPSTTSPAAQPGAPIPLASSAPIGAQATPAVSKDTPADASLTPTPNADGTASTEPPKPVDMNAPKLAVSMSTFADASKPSSASVTVTVKNAGGRPMVAALRQRMLSFEVVGPDRTVTCFAWPPTHAIPRDGFREYKPDASTSFTVLLDEVCPDEVFSRPGLYAVKAGIWANEPGTEIGVDGFTGRAKATAPTLLRLQSAKDPFYREPPKAVPTPKAPTDDAAPSPAVPSVPGSAPAAQSPAAPSAPSAAPSAPPAPSPATPKDAAHTSP